MVSLSHLLTFFMILSFVLFLGYSSVPATNGIGQNANDTMTKLTTMSKTLNSSLTVVTNAPLIGTISFPNVFAIFWGVFDTLFSVVQLPIGLFGSLGTGPNGLPAAVLLGLSGVLLVLTAIKVVGFFKGDSS